MNDKHSYAVFTFRPTSSACLQEFGQFSHTWSSTGVSSMAIGVYSVGVCFTSSSHHFTRAGDGAKLHW